DLEPVGLDRLHHLVARGALRRPLELGDADALRLRGRGARRAHQGSDKQDDDERKRREQKSYRRRWSDHSFAPRSPSSMLALESCAVTQSIRHCMRLGSNGTTGSPAVWGWGICVPGPHPSPMSRLKMTPSGGRLFCISGTSL